MTCERALPLLAVLGLLAGVPGAVAAPGEWRGSAPAAGEAAEAQAAAFSVVLPLVARDTIARDSTPVPYPEGTRTTIPALDGVLAALEAETPEALKALFDFLPAPCVVNPQGITNPPLCPGGVPAGTLVPVFRALSCESVWPDYLEEVLRDVLWRGPRPVLAIYRDPTDAWSWLPPADYAIVVMQVPHGNPAVVRVSGGRVTGIDWGCGNTFDKFVAGIDAARFVLPPQR